MPRHPLCEITAWITEAAVRHPDDLPDHLAQRLGLQPRTARTLCHELVALQWLVQERSATRRLRFAPGPLRHVVRRYPLAGDLRRQCGPLPDDPPRSPAGQRDRPPPPKPAELDLRGGSQTCTLRLGPTRPRSI